MPAQIIFEDDAIRVVHVPGRSAVTLMTFAPLGHRPRGATFWAQLPSTKLGIEAIGFVAHKDNWYPAASMRAAEAVLRPLLRRPAVGYGASMGGYAVLKYGRLLGLTHGLAISPQVSIDPADMRLDRRFHHLHDATRNAGMMVRPGDAPPVCVVAGDPHYRPDRLHLDIAAQVADAKLLPLPFHQHATAGRFASTKTLAALLDLILLEDCRGMDRYLRGQRSANAHAHLWVARTAEMRGHGRLAARLWSRAHSLGATPAEIARIRAMALRERLFFLAASRRVAEGRAIADDVIAAQQGNAAVLLTIGKVMQIRNLPDVACLAFEEALRQAPDMAEAQAGYRSAMRGREAHAKVGAVRGGVDRPTASAHTSFDGAAKASVACD